MLPLPVGGILQGLGGIAQAIFGGGAARRNEKKLEGLINSYRPNAGIMDYYDKALSRYSSNPYTSSLYQQQTKNINRNVNAGISALQDRRSGLAGISSLVQGANDASQKAAAGAESQQGQQLAQLGQASQVKAQEEFKPFEMKYNLLAAKAAGGNKVLGAGLQNIFGGINSIQNSAMLNKVYGGANGGGEGGYDNSTTGTPTNTSLFLNKYGGFRDLYK